MRIFHALRVLFFSMLGVFDSFVILRSWGKCSFNQYLVNTYVDKANRLGELYRSLVSGTYQVQWYSSVVQYELDNSSDDAPPQALSPIR